MLPTVTFTFDESLNELLKQTIQQEVARQVREILSQVPVPEVMFTFPQAAKQLSLHPETLRDYSRLPFGHRLRLRYVQCTNHSRGDRITGAELLAWQQRNDCDYLREATLKAITARQGRRRCPPK